MEGHHQGWEAPPCRPFATEKGADASHTHPGDRVCARESAVTLRVGEEVRSTSAACPRSPYRMGEGMSEGSAKQKTPIGRRKRAFLFPAKGRFQPGEQLPDLHGQWNDTQTLSKRTNSLQIIRAKPSSADAS